MKKKLLLLAVGGIMTALGLSAQGTITLTTSAPTGTQVRILPNVKSATQPLEIDWGNGVAAKYTVDPSQAAYNRWIEGTVEGTTITVKGYVTEFELSDAQLTTATISGMSNLEELDLSDNCLTDFTLTDDTPLTRLNLSHNNLRNNTSDNPTLSLEWAGETLTSLSLSYNTDLVCLDIRDLTALEYFTANDCPNLGSVFICMPEDSRPALRQINLSNCYLAHFYPVSLPQLRQLNLSNNDLMTEGDTEPFTIGDNYPELTSLAISGNTYISSLDVTGCTKLTSLSASDCSISSLDLSQCPELLSLSISNNKLTSLDLGNNTSLQSLYIDGNAIKEIDFARLDKLQDIDISNTQIARADLINTFYLKTFKARNTLLEFVDFNGCQANRVTMIDLRDNKRMTSETVDYTLHTLPVSGTSYTTPNLLLSGSNAEHADTDYPQSIDLGWTCDIEGDGTASHDNVAVTIDGTDTGENKTGTKDPLYPHFGMTLDYDLDVWQTDGGKFLIAQWQPTYYQSIKTVTTEAMIGVPIHIYPYPDEGKKFRSVTVNGTEITDRWFVISEPSTITVNFTNEESSVTLTTNPGQAMSFLVNTVEANGTVSVDWGTGTRTEYPGQRANDPSVPTISGTRIEGTAASSTVTIYGDIAAINLEGYGSMAEWLGLQDNHVTAIDLSNCPDLKKLNLYWNPVSTIDLSKVPELQILDVSYTNLKTLDLSNNPDMLWLEAYSDGYGDEDEGISQLTSISVSNMPYLQYLDVKGNLLTQLDVTQCPILGTLTVTGNQLTSLDVTKNPELITLNAANNSLSSLDISKNTMLQELSVGGNNLTELDLSNNTALATLMFNGNDIHSIDLSMLAELKTIYLNGNSLTAGELNDIYYRLPQRKPDSDDEGSGMETGWNIAVIQGGDGDSENDGNRADSSIAVDRGWTPSHTGTNGGCDVAYLDILQSSHGTVKVFDAQGNEYVHGSKVPKYEPLTIVPSPEQGYTMIGFSINGEEMMTGTAFDMPGIYTKLRPTFARGSGIDTPESGTPLTVAPGTGHVTAYAPSGQAHLSLYTPSGVAVFDGDVTSGQAISLEPGIYIARINDAADSAVVTVTVK